MTDFDALADLAFDRETLKPTARENQVNLWKAFFELPEWLFIVDARQTPLAASPFVGYLEDQAWFFLFTDSEKAQDFAEKNDLTDADGKCIYLSIKPESALKTLHSAEGQVEGIRVNEGPKGWFAPIANVHAIHKLLQENA